MLPARALHRRRVCATEKEIVGRGSKGGRPRHDDTKRLGRKANVTKESASQANFLRRGFPCSPAGASYGV
jgi:hypothetical protein